jgi:hypothetical protein
MLSLPAAALGHCRRPGLFKLLFDGNGYAVVEKLPGLGGVNEVVRVTLLKAVVRIGRRFKEFQFHGHKPAGRE